MHSTKHSRLTTERSVDLGDIDPAGSRQLGRRSSVCFHDDVVITGLADGSVVAFDDTGDGGLAERWRHESARSGDESGRAGSIVSLVSFADGVLAGERGADGELRFHDAETGDVRWRYRTADDVGEPQKETRFFLPFVVDAVTDGERAYVASRRYERGPDGDRTFQSLVYAFEPNGSIAWRYAFDASPIALDTDGDRVAFGCNRCPGDQQDGLVVLDATTGEGRRRWNPPGDGQRRIGDVSLVEGGIVVASHADYRGYLIDGEGVRWQVDLARPVERGDETIYAYPNHVHATDDGVVFVTGNTYPEDGRETDARHPAEHTAVGVRLDGTRRWESDVNGFAHEITAEGSTIVVPVAQHFRDRDPDVHGFRAFDVVEGVVADRSFEGVGTAAAVAGRIAVVEEPVSYHTEERVRGSYRLHR